MKKLILLSILLIATTGFELQTDVQNCWRNGYIAGWCHYQNQNIPCMKPAGVPYMPILPYNQRNCEGAYNQGIIKGANDYKRH